jgi:hypothetical protein
VKSIPGTGRGVSGGARIVPSVADIYDDVTPLSVPSRNFDPRRDEAWTRAECDQCGEGQVAVVAFAANNGKKIVWLRCVSCRRGMVSNNDVISPPPIPLGIPRGVVDDNLSVWNEVRRCLGVGAYSAAVMMCRKLLFHVAVSHGLAEKNGNGRAPNFYQALEHLQDEGIITAPMRKWADRIKDVGNQQNHEIAPIDPDDARDIARFTEKLLELAFEMDFLYEEGTTRSAIKVVE